MTAGHDVDETQVTPTVRGRGRRAGYPVGP